MAVRGERDRGLGGVARLGLTEDLLAPYGRYTAKIRLETLERFPTRRGKLILVTAITPTTSGEGKTVNTIGLPRYAARESMDFNKGVEFEVQANPLHLNLRPRAVVKLTKS